MTALVGLLSHTDVALAAWANHLGAGVVDPFTDAFCAAPPYLALLLVLAGIGLWRTERRRFLGTALGVALTLHLLVNEVLLKHVLGVFRTRPYLAHADAIAPVGYPFADSSFPSSHTASAAAAMTVLCFAFPRAAPFGAVFVVTMAACRVHNGMHYPSDVLCGALLGLVYGLTALAVGARVELGAKGAPPDLATS